MNLEQRARREAIHSGLVGVACAFLWIFAPTSAIAIFIAAFKNPPEVGPMCLAFIACCAIGGIAAIVSTTIRYDDHDPDLEGLS